MSGLLDLGTWVPILDGDPAAAAMYDRHYSSAKSRATRAARGTLQFGGPGSRLILTTPNRDALFGWRRQKFRMDKQRGVECFIFRNEGGRRGSELIVAACGIADRRWPGVRQFTFVDERHVWGNPPGNVFLRADWRYVLDEDGERIRSTGDLLVLERIPA